MFEYANLLLPVYPSPSFLSLTTCTQRATGSLAHRSFGPHESGACGGVERPLSFDRGGYPRDTKQDMFCDMSKIDMADVRSADRVV